ncbi:aminopeptidase P family protein [Bradyrhizobium tropiciagri]|uniref:M24 family metallopeptidase n=1 Tax=Bradyrhizobium tropiciagri TaxID=312253 RepID=UPI001BA81321|nr:Xaa-Pro peptidase family protein [Bradyrhizobium tropiciagri]MBR0898928.1 aminopeptidase P family protein [Bradyrhizobium tropiciagri]
MNWPLLNTIPHTPFSREEYLQRITRAQDLMRRSGIDTALATFEYNFRYFTGDMVPTPYQTTRPRFILIPSDGLPIALVPSGVDDVLRETTWITEIRTWPSPNPADEGVSVVAATLAELTGKGARIGIELGAESRPGLPGADLQRLAKIIAPRMLIDATEAVFTPLRMKKSPAEIDRIRTVCRIASEAFLALPRHLRTGMTEREACRAYELECFLRGADKIPKISSVAGRGGHRRAYTAPTDRIIARGDVLYLDSGCHFDFYWCDFNRYFAFGSIDDDTAHAYEVAWQATEAGLSAVRPGVMARDVWRAMQNVFDRHAGGVGNTSIGRYGHSMGLWMPEPPSISATDETVLEEGMILNIEPSLPYRSSIDGDLRLMIHEENVVVTKQGSELLTLRASRECPVITN